MSYGKSIEIFLVNGVIDSFTTAELSNWNGKAIKIPRSEIENTKSGYLESVGVYMLFCRNDDNSESVYIGEAENVRNRLLQHMRDYQKGTEEYYWSTALIFIGSDLNKAYIRYLENRLVDKCKECGRYKCLTKNTYKDTVLKESQKSLLEEFLENILMLSGILGYSMSAPCKTDFGLKNITLLKCKGNGADATGFVSADGFTVLKDSKVSDHLAKSMSKGNKLKREFLESSGIIVDRIFKHDYEFGSPSGASSIILGNSSNGNDDWKSDDGTPLKKLMEVDDSSDNNLPQIDTDPKTVILKCIGNGANASGFLSPKGFTVMKGSKVSDHLMPSGNESLRKNLESSGIIVNGIFTIDYEFGSPSGASSTILGRSSNGNKDWKTECGISLNEVRENYSSDESSKSSDNK